MDANTATPPSPAASKPPVMRLGLLSVAVAFALGLLYPAVRDWFLPVEQAPTPPRITMPGKGQSVQTDELSVRLFHYYLQRRPVGNLVVTPANITLGLNTLQQLTSPELAAVFAPLNPATAPAKSSAAIHSATLFFTNEADSLPGIREQELVYPVDFSGDLATAHQEMNNTIQYLTNGAISHMFSSSSAPRSTRMLAAAVLGLDADWYYPFRTEHTKEGLFRNADATRSKRSFMQTQGNFRMAKDPLGKWQAVALFLRNTPQGDAAGADSCALILILPTEQLPISARPLAASLSPADFNTIRTALATAAEKPATIKLPRMIDSADRVDLFPALQAMGLSALIAADAAPFPQVSNSTPFPLDGFYQQSSITFRESPASAIAPPSDHASETTIEFNRPFIWMLCPLTSPAPPYAIGVQEYL